MNYYPNNFYQNYSYGNMYQPQQAQPAVAALQGKVVDSVDMVRVNEVPFGGFGVFPKGDLSEIYVKSWNNNGTTQINTYKPIPVEETKEAKEISSRDELLEKINALNEKLDALMNNTAKQAPTSAAPAAAKDVKVNAY
jgi:hypothetical protein